MGEMSRRPVDMHGVLKENVRKSYLIDEELKKLQNGKITKDQFTDYFIDYLYEWQLCGDGK